MTATTFMIKKFGVISVAKFCAVFGLVWGFLMGLMVAGIGIAGVGSMMGSESAGLGIGAGIIGLVFMIVIGAIGGFISGAIGAVIYNVILGLIGGIEIDLETKA